MFAANKLLLNMSKTKVTYFGNCRGATPIKVELDSIDIEIQNEIRFLGVIMD